MTEFVLVRHPDVTVDAVVARTALPHLPGWQEVTDPDQPDAPAAVPEPPTTTAPAVDGAPAPEPASPAPHDLRPERPSKPRTS